MKIAVAFCLGFSGVLFCEEPEHRDPAKNLRGESSDQRELKKPEGGSSVRSADRRGDLPVFRCRSPLGRDESVKDAELECRSGDKKVFLGFDKLKEIERKTQGIVVPACIEQGSNRHGAEADRDKLREKATNGYFRKYFEVAIEACKEKFQKEVGVVPADIKMLKPTVYYNAKKGDPNAKVIAPERFSGGCVATEDVGVIDSFGN